MFITGAPLTYTFVSIFHIASTGRVSRDMENGCLYKGRRSLAHLSSFSISRLPGVLVAMWKIEVYKRGTTHLHICPHFPHRDYLAC